MEQVPGQEVGEKRCFSCGEIGHIRAHCNLRGGDGYRQVARSLVSAFSAVGDFQRLENKRRYHWPNNQKGAGRENSSVKKDSQGLRVVKKLKVDPDGDTIITSSGGEEVETLTEEEWKIVDDFRAWKNKKSSSLTASTSSDQKPACTSEPSAAV